jgi:hypothetical protein
LNWTVGISIGFIKIGAKRLVSVLIVLNQNRTLRFGPNLTLSKGNCLRKLNYFLCSNRNVFIRLANFLCQRKTFLFSSKVFVSQRNVFICLTNFLCRRQTFWFSPKVSVSKRNLSISYEFFENRNKTFPFVPKFFKSKLELRKMTGDKDSLTIRTRNT